MSVGRDPFPRSKIIGQTQGALRENTGSTQGKHRDHTGKTHGAHREYAMNTGHRNTKKVIFQRNCTILTSFVQMSRL